MRIILLALLVKINIVGYCAEVSKIDITHRHPELNIPLSTMTLPDHDGWNKIQTGMTLTQVNDLVGLPIKESKNDGAGDVVAWKLYGEVLYHSSNMPGGYSFMVFFKNGLVTTKSKPYGEYSRKLTKPQIVNLSNQSYTHYPRFLDVRWMPVLTGGKVSYEIEIQYRSSDGQGEWASFGKNKIETDPYVNFNFIGLGNGRYRVRAFDESSIGPWSDYKNFSFSK